MNKQVGTQNTRKKRNSLNNFLELNEKIHKHKKYTEKTFQTEQLNRANKLKSSPKKYIYHFGPEHTEGSLKDKHLLGNKGANLAEMSRLGLQVPPGFTLTTELCSLFLKKKQKLTDFAKKPIESAVRHLEKNHK